MYEEKKTLQDYYDNATDEVFERMIRNVKEYVTNSRQDIKNAGIWYLKQLKGNHQRKALPR